MRIASIYLPSFPLQAALATAAPAAAASPIAVIGGSVVAACSRAAWAQGVRPGMVVSIARSHCADLVCLVRDPAGEAELVRTLADALLAIAPSVDLGGAVRGRERSQSWSLFVEVPAGKRGAAFGARVVEIAAGLGLKARVGIADDRFTAAVAASHGGKGPGDKRESDRDADGAVTCVPRGGAAAFLAPLPLGLLDLPAEVLHMLEALGVKTLGAFAELPPPSVARAWDADLQALARGDGGDGWDAYRPGPRITDRADLGGGVGPALQHLAERLAARLSGRAAARAEAELRLGTATGGPTVTLTAPFEADAIADELARVVGEVGDATRLSVHVLVHADDEDELAQGAPAAAAEPAAHVADEAEVAPLVLTPVPSMLGHRPEHRRTRRGKQRPRIMPGQARLFSREPGA